MSGRFEGESVLVTGAASAIGWAVAKQFASEGASVTVWDIDRNAIANVEKQAQEAGYRIRVEQLDLLNGQAIEQGVATLIAKEAHIDVLVNNVGGSLHTPQHFLELTDEHWQRVMDVNVTSAVRVTRLVIPHMVKRGYGRIVNLGSKAGRFGSLFTGANYAASKGAVQAMTLQIAHEFGPFGITCNAVCPGVILTERVDRLLTSRQTLEQRQKVIETIPVRRHGTVEDVAAPILFLAGKEAGFITGIMLDVNGGQAMSI